MASGDVDLLGREELVVWSEHEEAVALERE